MPLAIFCGCTARFVSDLVRNREDRFSHDTAQFISEGPRQAYKRLSDAKKKRCKFVKHSL